MRAVHRRLINPTPSALVKEYGEVIARSAPGPIVDVGCGYGRNAAFLSSFVVGVICVDIDEKALAYINSISADCHNLLNPLKWNPLQEPPPFPEATVGAIISVDWFVPELLSIFSKLLTEEGCLLIETINGQGGNYLQLPPFSYIRRALSADFDMNYFKERRVGPDGSDAGSFRVVATRHGSAQT